MIAAKITNSASYLTNNVENTTQTFNMSKKDVRKARR